jgi:hypothetical protein
MAHTYVDFRGKEFWPRYGTLQLWMGFMAREIDKISSVPPWLTELRNLWQAFANEELNEFTDLRLDELVNSDERANLVLACAERALERLKCLGEFLTKDVLAEILTVRPEDAGWGSNPNIPSAPVIEVGEQFVKLLRGEAGQEGSQVGDEP